MDWFKRRNPTKKAKALSVKIPDFKKEKQHFCDVFAVFDDGVERKLFGRVIYNEKQKHWSVNAVANGGFEVFIKLIEE